MPKLPKIQICYLFEMSQGRSRLGLIFLHADKHESFLQIDTMIFDEDGQASPKFPKQKVCNVFTISRKRS